MWDIKTETKSAAGIALCSVAKCMDWFCTAKVFFLRPAIYLMRGTKPYYWLNHWSYVLQCRGELLQSPPPPVYCRHSGPFREEDYAVDFCPVCGFPKVVYSVGITACPDCGKPLYPCSGCFKRGGCNYLRCMYGSPTSSFPELNAKKATNRRITQEEVLWFESQGTYKKQLAGIPWWRKPVENLPF